MVLLGAATVLPHSCSFLETQPRISENVNIDGREVSASLYELDKVRVRFSEKLAEKIEKASDSAGIICAAALKSVDTLLVSSGVVEMRRTFPYAGKFEARTRAEGLHLWYDAIIERYSSDALTRAFDGLSAVDGVETVEIRPKTILLGGPAHFDDPGFPVEQWNLYNDGSVHGSSAGCDINVVPVWEEFTSGNDGVIVAVIDGGIDWSHEDLAENMWHNPEQTGDMVYGYNFVAGSYLVTPQDHGTHVAGIVGAVSNNGKGISGVAGGNMAAGVPGVRLMSCQIFEGERSTSGAEAIKWSADHGAVIAQNSWGYDKQTGVTVTPRSDRDAIDYFIKYAGFDENGNQVGPMAGGLVVFAAGNDSYNINCPSSYEPCLAVSSLGADYGAAWYTNYGDWVDVAAPGGDARDGNEIYSTLPGNQYGYMQGTSQACPQVSGIAALAVAYLGGPGFTADMLRERIEKGVKDISMYNSPSRYLGTGLVDAYQILMPEGGEPPECIEDFKAEVDGNIITISCTLPYDPDDETLNMLLIYYGTEELCSIYPFRISDMRPGDTFSGSFVLPEYSTTYRLAASVTDKGGHSSPLSEEVVVTTGFNNPPEVEPLDGTCMDVFAYQTAYMRFRLSDPDGHDVKATLDPMLENGVIRIVDVGEDTVALRIDAPRMESGDYSFDLVVTDTYGAVISLPLVVSVLDNRPPEVLDDVPPGLVFTSDMAESETLPWRSFFKDEDGESLTVSLAVKDMSVAVASVNSFGNIVITPMSYGETWVEITAADNSGASAFYCLKVVVRDGTRIVDLYPNPVSDILNIRPGVEEAIGSVLVMSNSGSVVYRSDDEVISVFLPLQVDMSEVPGGIYTVVLKYDDIKIMKNVAKL